MPGKYNSYRSMVDKLPCNRRQFLQIGAAGSAGLVLGNPSAWAKSPANATPETNIDDALKIPKTPHSLPGACPGRVVEVHDSKAMINGKPDKKTIKSMFENGIIGLMGTSMKKSFNQLFEREDIVGIKVNPVGPGLMCCN